MYVGKSSLDEEKHVQDRSFAANEQIKLCQIRLFAWRYKVDPVQNCICCNNRFLYQEAVSSVDLCESNMTLLNLKSLTCSPSQAHFWCYCRS